MYISAALESDWRKPKAKEDISPAFIQTGESLRLKKVSQLPCNQTEESKRLENVSPINLLSAYVYNGPYS